MEIKPQELRIGNWVKWPNEKEPNEVQWEHGHWLGVFEKNYGYPHAIELTPEWLERFGFRRQNNAWNGPDKSFDFSIWNPFKTESEFTLNDTVLCPRIYFVHQLQNLYFALTGEELAIDKTSLKN